MVHWEHGTLHLVSSSWHLSTNPVLMVTTVARETLVDVARSGIKTGCLTIVDSGKTYTFGDRGSEKGPHVSVIVTNPTFWTRVLL